ncbi:MAG: 50S ribosomal protein L30 [Clostridia bacterium]|nr:50S ribosomal protein L30 [Clostridia bacterium]
MNKIKVTLTKSLICAKPKNKAVAIALGLRKIGDCVVLPDTDATKGQIRHIAHLVTVENAD